MKTNYWLSYPADYKKQLKPLLHQQMWLFGQDILCPEGNLLYRYQFTHKKGEKRGGSMYTRWEKNRQIVLWGWGIWFGQTDMGSIFVNRYKAKPRYTALPRLNQTIHGQARLPHLVYRVGSEVEVETMRRLWCDLLFWLAEYEAWVLEACGCSWRQSALKPFSHTITKLTEVEQLAINWEALAEQSQTLPIKSYTYT